MTATTVPAAPRADAARLPLPPLAPLRRHPGLLALAAAMGVLAIVSAIGMLVDDRQVTGLDVWAKPFKFAISTGLYALSIAWLLGQLRRRGAARWIGRITALGLTVELAIITSVAALGDTSHFNVSTPLHQVLWYSMAGFIAAVWIVALIAAVLLLRHGFDDRARALAVRAGVVIAVIGMGLAILMTVPPQSDVAAGIGGAHTVGLADGGPGLPVLGWSTVGGDLRVPHFVGMHALQVLPLIAVLLELGARRMRVLASAAVRFRLLAVAVAGYAALVGLVTWQALAGQSVVRPEGAVLMAGIAVAALVVAGLAAVLVTAPRRRSPAVG